MKKFWLVCVVVTLTATGAVPEQQQEEPLKETVQVVNVEVPVRVYFKGKPVDNLNKTDFRLYEDRKLQEINGFILKRKKIQSQQISMTAEQAETGTRRLFVLVFRITHYNDDLKTGVEHLFTKVLRPTDQLLVFANNRSARYDNLNDAATVRAKIEALLDEESIQARNKMVAYLQAVETELNLHEFEMNIRSRPVGSQQLPGGQQGIQQPYHIFINNFLSKYIMIWRDYKKKYLVPDINRYYNFAKFLQNIPHEKWVIDFYQMEMFPRIKLGSEVMRRIRNAIGQWQVMDGPEGATYNSFARIISRQLAEIQKEMNLSKDFPSDEVAKIFHDVDTTFHSIFMRTSRSALAQDVEYQDIASDVEKTIRDITDRTGGELIVSNKLDTALEAIGEAEDIYYILTYAPEEPEKVGKIKIKLNNSKYKLVYSPNIRSGYLRDFIEAKEIDGPPVQIRECQFKNNKLSLILSDFYWSSKHSGRLTIRIQIKNRQGISIFDQEKNINATKKEIKIALNITGVGRGTYNIVVDVEDLLTKKTASEIIHTTIK
jgi:hypothetical protein